MSPEVLERRALDLADGVRAVLIDYRRSAGNVAMLEYHRLVDLFEEASNLAVDIRETPDDLHKV